MSLWIQTLILAIVFGAGWAANGWRLGSEHYREALATAEATKQIGIEANNAISAADQRVWKGMQSDKKELARLRGCVADGTCGVRLITKPAAAGASDPGPGGLGDDTLALDPDVQRRVLDHREAIGEDQRKIEYLQGYALICQGGRGSDGSSD